MAHSTILTLVSLIMVTLGSAAIDPGVYCGYNPSSLGDMHPGHVLDPNYKLVHLSVMIRHGDRLPATHAPTQYTCWPNSPPWSCDMVHQERPTQSPGYTPRLYQVQFLPNRNVNPGNCGQGRLTKKGYEQQLHNGRMLKDLYITQSSFLPFTFDPTLFYFRATNVPRTQLSAESLLLGLYNTTSSTTGACDTEMYTIYTVDNEMETMYPNSGRCPKLGTLQKQWMSSSKFQAYFNSVIQPLNQQLSPVFNMPLSSVDIDSFFDCLQAHACHQMPFPSGLTQDIYDGVVAAGTWVYAGLQETLSAGGNTWTAIAMGDFVAEFVSVLDSVVAGETQLKMTLFSGHDTTLMPLLAAYGVWDGIWPPYASMLRLHLLQDNSNNYFVEFIYNNGSPLAIPGCSQSPCPYSQFRAVSNSIIKSASTECTSNNNEYSTKRDLFSKSFAGAGL